MAKNSDENQSAPDQSADEKTAAAKEAEKNGGETYQPDGEDQAESADSAPVEDTRRKCPDCNGEGIRNANDNHVCPTCEGTGKA